MLVEYVRGQNAGKALLSRVRNGVYLSEGYAFHSELANPIESSKEARDSSLLVMMTFQRILLLNVKDNLNLFSMKFEIQLDSILFAELIEGDVLASNNADFADPTMGNNVEEWSVVEKYDSVTLWYFYIDNRLKLHDESNAVRGYVENGLKSLKCQTLFWKTGSGEAERFIDEIRKVKPELETS